MFSKGSWCCKRQKRMYEHALNSHIEFNKIVRTETLEMLEKDAKQDFSS